MTYSLAEDMLAALAKTANGLDYEAHMALISPTVRVFGVPGFAVIGYDDWARQCRHEFAGKLLKSVRYEGLDIVSCTPGHVLFKTREIIEGTDGTVNDHGLEILIQQEADGLWRITQERLLSPEEVHFDRHRSSDGPP